MLPDFLRELNPFTLLGLAGVAALAWLALMYAVVEAIVRLHAWWTR